MQLKNNIWKQETSKGTLFIKKYENQAIADKVKFIHKQLESIRFPYVIPLVKSKESDLIVQMWQNNSNSADFSIYDHRQQSLTILEALHRTNKIINWKNQTTIPRQNLQQKWNARLERFILHENELRPYLQHGFDDIVKFSERVLKQMRRKQFSNGKMALLHGDVVHHNFLICNEKEMKLIDFDLAVLGDPAEELVLWMHRVLPTVEYDLSSLLKENTYLANGCLKKLNYLQYPNELLREWLYFLQLGNYEREAFLEYLMPFTKNALSHWPQLVQEIEKIQSHRY